MSMGARYIALHKDRLNALLSDPQASLSAFVFDDANQALITSYSLEQAWDAFRCLFEDDLPELNGGEFLQDADLGEGCFLISADAGCPAWRNSWPASAPKTCGRCLIRSSSRRLTFTGRTSGKRTSRRFPRCLPGW